MIKRIREASNSRLIMKEAISCKVTLPILKSKKAVMVDMKAAGI